MPASIEIIQTDITILALDAIVNAANRTLLGGGGVDGAIHRAAGPEMLAACRLLGGCQTGEAKITPGFRLPARYVIHAVAPVWQGGTQGEPELLRACYRNAFDLARAYGIASIAFPAIGTGIYGYPLEEACHIAVQEAKRARDGNLSLIKVVFAVFSDDAERIYERYVEEIL